jgi:hypothetical protein
MKNPGTGPVLAELKCRLNILPIKIGQRVVRAAVLCTYRGSETEGACKTNKKVLVMWTKAH